MGKANEKDINWAILDEHMQRICDRSHTRTYAGSTANVSGYIKDKWFCVEGDFDYVLTCVKAMSAKYGKTDTANSDFELV